MKNMYLGEKGILTLILFVSIIPTLVHINTLFDISSINIPLTVDQLTSWRGNPEELQNLMYRSIHGGIKHAILEWSAVTFAFACFFLALVHHSMSKEPSGLVIGFALGFSGLMDLFHTLAATRLIEVIAQNETFIPLTWAVSRCFSAFVLLGGGLWLAHGKRYQVPINPSGVFAVLFSLSLLAFGLMAWMMTAEALPQTQFPSQWISRPYDVIPFLIFAGTLPCFIFLYRQTPNYLFLSLIGAVALLAFSEAYMAFGSKTLFDHYFNSAHALKVLAYTLPFIGYVGDYRLLYEKGLEQEKNLEEKNSELKLSRARYENITQLMPVGMMIVDQNGRIIEANNTSCEMFGYNMAEFMSLSIEALVPHYVRDHHDQLRQQFQQSAVQRKMAANNKSLSGQCKDGSLIALEIGLAPIRITGHPCVLVSLMNVQERRQSVNELEQLKTRYQSINRYMPSGVMIVGERGQILEVNITCCELFGYAERELLSLRVEDLVPNTIRSGHASLRESFAKDPKPRRMAESNATLSGVKKDGSAIALEIGLSPIDLNGEKCILVSLINVEERRRVLAELEIKNQQMDLALEKLQQSNEQLERFAFICSHDLQEPVRMVLSFSQLLEKKAASQLDDKALGYLGHITDGAIRAREMISDILDFCRLEQNSEVRSDISLNDILEKVDLTLKPQLEERNAVFEWHDNLPTLQGGATQIFQLFLNLVSNGIKFNQSEQPKVEVVVEDSEGFWLITVADNGIGIDQKYTHKLFTIFTRLNAKNDYSGTGIGLAICKKVVELHGANIQITSVLNSGSKFIIRWPKNAVQNDQFHPSEFDRNIS